MTMHGFRMERLRINEAKSQETACYTAAIVFEGEVVGRAENDGWGGVDMALFFDSDYRDIFESAAADAYPGINLIEASDRLLADLFVAATNAEHV